MNIGLITSMKYGLTQFIFRDIDALVRKGHGLHIFTLYNRPGLYNPRPEWPVTAVSRSRLLWRNLRLALRRPRLYGRLLTLARRTRSFVDLFMAADLVADMNDIDIMYAYFGDHKLFVGYYCKLIANIPLVVTIRAYELYNNPNPTLFVEALKGCDHVATITDYNRQLLTERYGVPAERITIIRQIVDLESFRYRPKIKILIVGFFAEKKGHEILFRALRQMDRDDVEVWVVGDITRTVRTVDVRRLADEIGVAGQVAFFGAQKGNALRALYNECDIFCLPSRPDRYGEKEGFPNVIAEAMAFGKPVVSTRHAGIPEAIDTFLVDENDADALAVALNEACDSVELRQRVGRENRARVERLFSPANNDRLEALLRRYARNATPTPAPVASLDEAEANAQ